MFKQKMDRSKHTLRERNASMFDNEFLADVHFMVGKHPNERVIPAHKYILATASPVFHDMFYGAPAPDYKGVIHIPDIIPSAFYSLLW